MFAGTTLQQEMGLTILFWVSFLVAWIIMAARRTDTASSSKENPWAKTSPDRSISRGSTLNVPKLTRKPMLNERHRRRDPMAAFDDFDRPF